MKILSSIDDKVEVIDNFISKKECQMWIEKANKSYTEKQLLDIQQGIDDHWQTRTVDITSDKIVQKINQTFKGTIFQAQLQTWPIGSVSKPHIHDDKIGDETAPSRLNTKMNSVIYLNDNFDGGLFHTYWGVVIKPKQGTLIHFDGSKIYHGVSEVKNNNRYTLIFWWKDETN